MNYRQWKKILNKTYNVKEFTGFKEAINEAYSDDISKTMLIKRYRALIGANDGWMSFFSSSVGSLIAAITTSLIDLAVIGNIFTDSKLDMHQKILMIAIVILAMILVVIGVLIALSPAFLTIGLVVTKNDVEKINYELKVASSFITKKDLLHKEIRKNLFTSFAKNLALSILVGIATTGIAIFAIYIS